MDNKLNQVILYFGKLSKISLKEEIKFLLSEIATKSNKKL